MIAVFRDRRIAAAEQTRADGLARRIAAISTPGHPSHDGLPMYQLAYRQASATAARHTTQPRRRTLRRRGEVT